MRTMATLVPQSSHPLRCPTHSSISKIDHSSLISKGISISSITQNKLRHISDHHTLRCHSDDTFGVLRDEKGSIKSLSQEVETFLLNAIHMNFFERVNLAWKIIFPPRKTEPSSSNAMIAKQRLKMILFSDRCEVSEEAKRKIVNSIVGALSDFVVIESHEKVQLSVSEGYDFGTLYSVTVPIRRVKPEYQEDDGYGSIVNVEYMDESGLTDESVDVKFDFYVPSENSIP